MLVPTVIYGFHALTTQLTNAANTVDVLYITDARQDKRLATIVELAKTKGIKIEVVPTRKLDQLAHAENHQGVVGFLNQSRVYNESEIGSLLQDIDNKTLILVLDGVQDPHNLGACLRSADGAGVRFVIAPKDNACGLTPVVKKVASGAAELVPFIQVTNLARTLRLFQEKGIWLVGLDDQAETDLYQTDLDLPCAIVLGAEGSGLRRLTKKHCDYLTHIPMQGSVSSLNVSVAAGISLFEARRQKS